MSHSPADLEEFMASPEMEAAFNAWLAKRNPAMVDLSEGALEPFPKPRVRPFTWHVSGIAFDAEGKFHRIEKYHIPAANETEARAKALGDLLSWAEDAPIVTLHTPLVMEPVPAYIEDATRRALGG